MDNSTCGGNASLLLYWFVFFPPSSLLDSECDSASRNVPTNRNNGIMKRGYGDVLDLQAVIPSPGLCLISAVLHSNHPNCESISQDASNHSSTVPLKLINETLWDVGEMPWKEKGGRGVGNEFKERGC